jgi:cytochrome c553
MGRNKRIALALAPLFVFAFAITLVACSPAAGEPLRDIHEEGQLENVISINRGLCLSCHNEHAIIESTENYGGQAGLNIHQPPESMMANYGDCATCHEVDEFPVLTCNTSGCHDFKLPTGWSAP